MKITYSREFKRLIIDGEENLIIPLNGKACISMDSENLRKFNKDTGVLFSFENFVYKGLNYLTLKDKLRLIIMVIKA